MSPAPMDRNFRSRSGKVLPVTLDTVSTQFASMISDALRREFGAETSAVKTICRLTGAEERAVKNWFEAKNGPTGRHLVALMAASDAVLEAVLAAAGRRELVVANRIAESKRQLLYLLQHLHDLQRVRMTTPLDRSSLEAVLSLLKEAQMSDPAAVIREAIHSAFVKYPMEDDPDFSHHWIKPEESAHIAKAIMLELEANGYQIIKKSS